ncbi:hypothetical protein H0Z09_05480 [Pseudomonas sp. SWRI18]|uniref:dermonecrotic toxin domain-containing protein n=1 Tax=Pseudomonas sp. SWRI18 TaxID=2753888 RepID=UPI0016446C94|nr:DUF6543 domain-containing protein [Pseudomonas sp. SWRI18]MBC3300562.1 hypothetical protein [Pseudomonas sp. SWRI18]
MSITSHYATSLPSQHISDVSTRSKRETKSPPIQVTQTETGAAASVSPHEKALLDAYLKAVQSKALHGNAGLVKVPPQSTLGQWLELYRAQLEHPVVQNWLREQKIDPTSLLSIDPFKGTLSADAGGTVKTFSLSDASGWGQVSGPILAAAKVIWPEDKGVLRVRLRDGFTEVSAKVVAKFQGIPLPANPSQANAQIRQLQDKDAFDPIAADDRARPAGSRSPQALDIQKQQAAIYYRNAPQALEYKRLAVNVGTHLPNTRAEAKKWAEQIIFQLTGKQVDADTIYLNRFRGANTPLSSDTATVTGWEHSDDDLASSQRLPDALLKNFNEHDGVPGNLDQEAGLYMNGPGQGAMDGYGAHNQFPLAPSALMHASWKTDFQAQMTQKIDHFWNTQTSDYETVIKGEFVNQARKQLKANEARPTSERTLQAPEHKFSHEDYRLVMGAASNLPIDEKTPLTVEQLKAKAPAKDQVQVHALNIHGFTSSDILRFSAPDDGRQVLYIPGAEPAFLRFDSLEKLNQWIVEQTQDPKKREALAAHFPLIYRQDHEAGFAARAAKVLMPVLWFTHVGDKTEGLDTHFEKMANGTLKDPAVNNSHSAIEEDVFSTLATSAKERMKSDADVVIKSNSEVIRDTWLNDITVAAGLLAKLAPIAAPAAAIAVVTGLAEVALGAEKASSGDTEAERKDGASKTFDGVLNTLFSVGGFAGEAEDPFASPEQKLPVSPRSQKSINGFTDRLYNWLNKGDAQPGLTKNEFKEFQNKYNASRTPKNRANFDNGYNSGNLNNVPGYSPSMTLPDLMKMASEPWRSAEEVGTLSRAIERLKIKLIQEAYPAFQRDIQSAGGSVTPMPQEFYLSQANLASQGECAAMSNTMGMALESGQERTFLANLFKAAASPNDAASANFIKNLSTLQEAMTELEDFHAAPIKQVAYSEIIADLANAADSKALRITSTDHAVLAGVKMEGETPKWFYFDPNFGLATFDSPQAFERGMERVLNRGTSPFRHRALGSDPAVPEYTISEFTSRDYAGNSLAPTMRSLFTQEL